MFQSKIGASTNAIPEKTGREAATQVKDLCNNNMAFVYGWVQYDQK